MFKIGLIILIVYFLCYNVIIEIQQDHYSTYSTKGNVKINESKYDGICFKRNIFAWLPPILVIFAGIWIFYFKSDPDILFSLLGLLFFSSIAGMINSLHASRINIDIGKQTDMTDTKRFKKEEDNITYGKASIIGGTIYSAHHIKKNVKELTDVDSWKESK